MPEDATTPPATRLTPDPPLTPPTEGPTERAAEGAAAAPDPDGATMRRLDADLTELLRQQVPQVAEHTVRQIMVEVPAYQEAFQGRLGRNIEAAVQMALDGFLRLASTQRSVDASVPLAQAQEGAFKLGQGEARNGRSADALLSAYRVGARVAWRELSDTAVRHGVPAETVADFAELVFAYIDELSARSVDGHAQVTAASERLHERRREQLAAALAQGAPPSELTTLADAAGWAPPRTLTAVLLPISEVRSVLSQSDQRTLQAPEELVGLPADTTLLLVPDAGGRSRPALLRTLAGRHAVCGPERPWSEVRASYLRALRAATLADPVETRQGVVDTEENLVALVVSADGAALADLRLRALKPLEGLRPATREKLVATLRSWLLHHGRREEIAAELFVHPQTVRYRVGQLRELYGDALDDPRTVLELSVALA